MKKLAACIVAIASIVFASCSVDDVVNGVFKTADGLSGSGTNVFVGGNVATNNMIEHIESSVSLVLDSYESQEKKDSFDRAKENVENAIDAMLAAATGSSESDEAGGEPVTYDIETIKNLISELLDSITLEEEVQNDLVLEISKASVNESSRIALRDKLSNMKVSADTPAYDTYFYIMNKLAYLLRMMNEGRDGYNSDDLPYALRLSDSTSHYDLDFSPVFEEISEPTISDIVMMSMISNTVKSLMSFDMMSDLKVSEASELIGNAIDMYLVAEALKSIEENEYHGFVGIIQLIVDKLEIKGVLSL